MDEHDRPSAIARTHKPILISDMSSNSPSDITCSKHGFKADFFDSNSNLFLCQHCTNTQEETLLSVKLEPLSDAVKVIMGSPGGTQIKFISFLCYLASASQTSLPATETRYIHYPRTAGAPRDAEHSS